MRTTKRFGKKLARPNATSTFVWLIGFYSQRDIINLATSITMNFNYKFSFGSGLDEFQIPVLRQAVNVSRNVPMNVQVDIMY